MKLSHTATIGASGAVLLIGVSAIGLAQAPQGQAPAAPILDKDHLRRKKMERAAVGAGGGAPA